MINAATAKLAIINKRSKTLNFFISLARVFNKPPRPKAFRNLSNYMSKLIILKKRHPPNTEILSLLVGFLAPDIIFDDIEFLVNHGKAGCFPGFDSPELIVNG